MANDAKNTTVLWDQVPDGALLSATIRKKLDSAGTFAVSGWRCDSNGDSASLNASDLLPGPYTHALVAGRTYQFVFEVAPAGGAEVEVVVVVEKDGAIIRPSPQWPTVMGSPQSRSAIIRTRKQG